MYEVRSNLTLYFPCASFNNVFFKIEFTFLLFSFKSVSDFVVRNPETDKKTGKKKSKIDFENTLLNEVQGK